MITINFTADDLSQLRFAFRPLAEIPLSYRVLLNPELQPPYIQWVDEARRALHDLDLPYMHALMAEKDYIPNFLAPAADVNRYDVDADLQNLFALPHATIRENMLALIERHGDSEFRRHFLVDQYAALRCLADEMRLYWQRVLAQYWSQMVSTLEGDVLHHGRMLALNGATKLLEDLHPSIAITGSRVQIDRPCDEQYSLDGRGLRLVPVIFKNHEFWYHIPSQSQPMLAYGVHGVGLWCHKTLPSSPALELTLGAGRAFVLQALMMPKSNGELAQVLHLTTGAVSQHLTRLHRAGLVEPHRVGRRTYYRLTTRGEELIRLFERTG